LETGDNENAKPESLRRLRVGLTYNLKKNIATEPPDAEAEFDDYGTITAIKKALEAGDCEVGLFEANEQLPIKLIDNRPDIVFNIAEGMTGRGREAQVPAILNFLGIPFTGSDETTMCLAMDKALTKRLLASYHIRTPKYQIFKADAPYSTGKLSRPVIVKPNAEGSGKGVSDVSIISCDAELIRVLEAKAGEYKQDMLVEEFIRGREFTVGILGNGDKTHIFPPMEIIFNDNETGIYSYEVKRDFKEHVKYQCPPGLDPDILEELDKTAAKIYRIMKCRDCARIDFRLSPERRLYFIEINPLPGLAPGYSDFPMLAEFCGIDYISLIQSILDSALARYGMMRR